MKTILTLVVVLVGFVGNSQNRITEDSLKLWYSTNKLAVEKEFIHMIDTARDHIITEKIYMFHEKKGYTQSEFREIRKKSRENGLYSNFERKKYLTIFGREINYGKIIYVTTSKESRVPHLKYDSAISMAARHHAIYLNKVGFGHISHTEDSKLVKDYEVLENHWDRMNKYDSRRLVTFGECLTVTGSNLELRGVLFVNQVKNYLWRMWLDIISKCSTHQKLTGICLWLKRILIIWDYLLKLILKKTSYLLLQ